MGVYVVSLPWIRRRARSSAADQPSQSRVDGRVEDGSSDHAMEMDSSDNRARGAGQQGDLPPGLTQAEADAFTGQFGHGLGRALLGLIFRVSATEAQLAEVRGQLGRSSAPSVQPQIQKGSAECDAGQKPELLEQLFQNNLALWKSTQSE